MQDPLYAVRVTFHTKNDKDEYETKLYAGVDAIPAHDGVEYKFTMTNEEGKVTVIQIPIANVRSIESFEQ